MMETQPQLVAEVVFAVPLEEAFTYRIPVELHEGIEPGTLVKCQFGRQATIGCVIATRPDSGTREDLKPILGRASASYQIAPEILELSAFLSEYYMCSRGEALAAMSLVGFSDTRDPSAGLYRLREDWKHTFAEALTPKQVAACAEWEQLGYPVGTRAELSRLARISASLSDRLVTLEVLRPVHELDARRVREEKDTPLILTAEQEQAHQQVRSAACEPRFEAFLLFGITGSGKTEIYLRAMADVLEMGKTALCLVPEIALTPQTVERFERRFGGSIGVFHSQVTRREKLALWNRIQSGRIRVVIGARSAVFAPLPDLGLIVVDEEHEGSYKQGETPRYHARDLAVVRAQRLGIPVVLGSATPCMESFRNAELGKYQLLELRDRPGDRVLPPVTVVDLGAEAESGASAHLKLSSTLRRAMQDRLDKGEQSLLLLNRRGFSNFLFCPSCKWVAKCPEDDVALTVHRRGSPRKDEQAGELDLFDLLESSSRMRPDFELRCHFCGRREQLPPKCPSCAAEGMITVGTGTQRAEEEIAAAFPTARLLRFDLDTMGRKGAFEEGWRSVVQGDADIILGTQMIAKGLHLERVTLVGVVLCDQGLFLPDFRAEERTFTLLTQVAGRSGRESAGEVIFQTFLPRHSAIRHATTHAYRAFYEEELRRRRQMGFPPWVRLIAVTVSHEDRDKSYQAARLLGSLLARKRRSPGYSGVTISGPTVAPLARLASRYRYRILLRSERGHVARSLLRSALSDGEFDPHRRIRVAVDVDPIDLL
jgi:primosomal protein N' (replication factor Y)